MSLKLLNNTKKKKQIIIEFFPGEDDYEMSWSGGVTPSEIIAVLEKAKLEIYTNFLIGDVVLDYITPEEDSENNEQGEDDHAE